MSWQWAAVVAIEILAVAFLAYKVGLAGRPRFLRKPDVRSRDLVRKRRSTGRRSKR